MASEPSALHLAAFLCHTKSFERARSIIERVLRSHPDVLYGQDMLGWLLLSQYEHEDDALKDAEAMDEAWGLFEGVLLQDPEDLEVCRNLSLCLNAYCHGSSLESNSGWRFQWAHQKTVTYITFFVVV